MPIPSYLNFSRAVDDRRTVPANCVEENRAGSFIIPDSLFLESPEAVTFVLSKVVVVRAERLIAERGVRYDAFSMLFDKLEPNESPPFYEMKLISSIEEDGFQKLELSASRVKKEEEDVGGLGVRYLKVGRSK